MEKEQVTDLIEKHKYVFIGEIHGTKEIPKKTFELIKPAIKNKKNIFCLELPKQAEKELYKYLNKKISKEDLFKCNFLHDAVFDKRFDEDRLAIYEKLHKNGVILRCLENYDIEDINKRDEEMAKSFLEIIKEKADKYFVYVGNLHIIEEEIEIMGMKVRPIKIYLSKDILSNVLTIQFSKGEKEEVIFNKKTNTINYSLVLKEIKANFLNIKNNNQSN